MPIILALQDWGGRGRRIPHIGNLRLASNMNYMKPSPKKGKKEREREREGEGERGGREGKREGRNRKVYELGHHFLMNTKKRLLRFFCCCSCCLFWSFFEIGSHIPEPHLELLTSCFCLPGADVTGVHHHTWLRGLFCCSFLRHSLAS